MLKRSTIIEIVTTLNITLFLYTGITKAIDYKIFKAQLTESPFLSWASTPIALILPWFELLIVIMLIIPRWRLKGFYTSLVIMTGFTAYIALLFSIDKNMPCSCGGIIELLSWNSHLVFNGIFIILDASAIYLQKRENSLLRQEWNERSFSTAKTH